MVNDQWALGMVRRSDSTINHQPFHASRLTFALFPFELPPPLRYSRPVARKESPARKEHHGFNDVIGIMLISAALLLLVALFSFDKADLPIDRTNPNVPIRNWVGPFGAHLAHWAFRVLGASAYLLPFLLVGVALGYFFAALGYLRRRWLWVSVLLLCCFGLLDLYTNKTLHANLVANPRLPDSAVLERLALDLNAPSAGGMIGLWANKYLFSYFGRAGATIIFASLWLISLLFLTNFQLGEWLRGRWAREAGAEDDIGAQEKAIDRRARELEKEAKALQEQVAKKMYDQQKPTTSPQTHQSPQCSDRDHREF